MANVQLFEIYICQRLLCLPVALYVRSRKLTVCCGVYKCVGGGGVVHCNLLLYCTFVIKINCCETGQLVRLNRSMKSIEPEPWHPVLYL